ncbi:MAG: YceI family protein [Saprospiraceae bacterium]|nr:YceI family protein [Saprospiraceae bacterium]
MQKLLIFSAAFFIFTMAASAQSTQKFFTRDGKVKFDATAANSPEKIDALSNSATAVLDAATGNFQWAVLIKGFQFEKSLMQEHFNENYLESSKYPKATFIGKITNLGEVNLSKDGVYNAIVSGQMTLHGVTKDITTNGALTVNGSNLKVNAGFGLYLADYNVEIPSLVSDKIAKEAKILVDAALVPKQ